MERRQLLYQIMIEAESSLESYRYPGHHSQTAEHRLVFRELGLSIGLHGLPKIKMLVARDAGLTDINNRLLQFGPLAEQIETFWSQPGHRVSKSWQEHVDINSVMLATRLAPEGELTVHEWNAFCPAAS